jgi:hypothetical protein
MSGTSLLGFLLSWRVIAKPLSDRGDLPGSIVKMSRHYQPITAILYTRRMTTAAGAIQADKV